MFVCLSDPQIVADAEICTKSKVTTSPVIIMSICNGTEVS